MQSTLRIHVFIDNGLAATDRGTDIVNALHQVQCCVAYCAVCCRAARSRWCSASVLGTLTSLHALLCDLFTCLG
jgi:hypothetical protein